MRYFETYNMAWRYCANAGLPRAVIERRRVWMHGSGTVAVWAVQGGAA